MSRLRHFLLVLGGLLGAGRLCAETFTAVSTGGIWNVFSTWSPSGMPGPGDDVLIANGLQIYLTTPAIGLDLTVRERAIPEPATDAGLFGVWSRQEAGCKI